MAVHSLGKYDRFPWAEYVSARKYVSARLPTNSVFIVCRKVFLVLWLRKRRFLALKVVGCAEIYHQYYIYFFF
jgi:hypothetical protein